MLCSILFPLRHLFQPGQVEDKGGVPFPPEDAFFIDGKLVTLSLCRPEDPGLLGDTEYLTGEKAPSHVEAVEDAVLLEVRFDRERMEEDIALYRFLARMQLYKMQQVSRDAIRQAMFTLPQRFAGYLLAASDGGRRAG